MKSLCHFALALFCAAPALASVTVSSPVNGATVTSPFALKASSGLCSSQAIASMGYSLDSSSSTTVVQSSSLSASMAASLGSHVLHVKSWAKNGAACSTSISVNVVRATAPSTITNVTVASPLTGAEVLSPFPVAASGTLCQGQPITAMGYSLDSSSSTTIFKSRAINGNISATAGSHTLRVKAWGNLGASCRTSVSISVQGPPPVTSAPSIPSNATAINAIPKLGAWKAERDAGTPGSASGAMQVVASPSISGSARQFATSYTDYGGERYHLTVGSDQVATNFVYDTRVYIASPSSDIAVIEMDLNQVIATGDTVIYGFQCDGWSNTWDYTENSGTPNNSNSHWLHSNQTCSPQKWATGTWHHVQIQYSRDDSGNVTYKAVWLDGVEQDLNVTVPSAFALNWKAPSLLVNFQVDGATSTSGSSTVYLDNLTIYTW